MKLRKKLISAFFLSLIFFVILIVFYYLKNPSPVARQAPSPTNKTFSSAMNLNALYYLGGLNKDIITSSIATNTYRGTLDKISTKPGNLKGFLYDLALSIRSDTNQKSFQILYFNKNNISKIEVLQNNSQKTISDLEIGDVIILKETLDLTKDFTDNRREIIITKL